MSTILAVAAGGAAGSVARYLVVVEAGRLLGLAFPWGTVAVNVAGSFLMGLLAGAAMQVAAIGPELRALLATGFLGGFTTFSAFSLDAWALAERGASLAAAGYVAGSVAAGLLALAAGKQISRGVLS